MTHGEGSAMATFVLVHGGWGGGSEWTPIARRLWATGHETYTPTLTGLGERAHLAGPNTDLATHVQDVVAVLECEDLRDVILLGHSSGSMVVTSVAERVPERLARLVYLDTIIPADGQSWFDLIGEAATDFLLELAQNRGDGWRIPFPFAPPDADRLPCHPLASVTKPLAIRNPVATTLPRTFVFSTGKGDDWFHGIGGKIAEAARKARTAGWDYRELPTGHHPHRERPEEFTALLLQLV